MALKMKFGETTIVTEFDLSTYLTSISETIGNMPEATFMLKYNPSVPDNESNYTATLGSGITKNGNTLEVRITDFSELDASKRYYVGLGVKFTGDSVFREVPLASSSKTFAFELDVIRG